MEERLVTQGKHLPTANGAYGPVAQLVEPLVYTEKIGGSSPSGFTGKVNIACNDPINVKDASVKVSNAYQSRDVTTTRNPQ